MILREALRNTRRPLVLHAQQPASVRVERDGPVPDFRRAERVAVVAHWDAEGRVARSPRTLVESLIRAGYETLLVSAAEGPEPLDWVGGRPGAVTVLRRPNLGYDFGSWATALGRFPEVLRANMVLLFNDSMAGPFAPIDGLLEHFRLSDADVWAMTDTRQLGHHLQSYCIGFKGGSLEDASLRGFWSAIRIEPTREAVIERYELGLSRLLVRRRVVVDVAIPSWKVVDGDDNPTIIGWRRLLDLGFPFVKRQILREPDICADGAEAPGELRDRFGVEAGEWL